MIVMYDVVSGEAACIMLGEMLNTFRNFFVVQLYFDFTFALESRLLQTTEQIARARRRDFCGNFEIC